MYIHAHIHKGRKYCALCNHLDMNPTDIMREKKANFRSIGSSDLEQSLKDDGQRQEEGGGGRGTIRGSTGRIHVGRTTQH